MVKLSRAAASLLLPPVAQCYQHFFPPHLGLDKRALWVLSSGEDHLTFQASTSTSAFAVIFSRGFNILQILPDVTHGVEHHLVTSGLFIASKFQRLDSTKVEVVRKKFDKKERDSIMQWSTSPWSPPCHMLQKIVGSWRACGDFRASIWSLRMTLTCYPTH
jgi:hypothetical protein